MRCASSAARSLGVNRRVFAVALQSEDGGRGLPPVGEPSGEEFGERALERASRARAISAAPMAGACRNAFAALCVKEPDSSRRRGTAPTRGLTRASYLHSRVSPKSLRPKTGDPRNWMTMMGAFDSTVDSPRAFESSRETRVSSEIVVAPLIDVFVWSQVPGRCVETVRTHRFSSHVWSRLLFWHSAFLGALDQLSLHRSTQEPRTQDSCALFDSLTAICPRAALLCL